MDPKNRRRLQDTLPPEAPLEPDSAKVESGGVRKETDKKPNGHSEGSKRSNPTAVPRSRSYFQFFFLKLLLVCGFIEFFWVCQCHYPIGGESSTIGILSSEKLSYAWVPMEIEDLSL